MSGQQATPDEAIRQFERILAAEAKPRVPLGGTPEPVVWYKIGGDLYEMPMAEFVQIVARATKANQ